MKKSVGLLLILSCMASAVAQENPDSSDDQMAQTEPVTSTGAEAEKQAADASSSQSASNAAKYRPSEDISEDLSVSFPVDI